MSLQPNQQHSWANEIANCMGRCGFKVRVWRGTRVYVEGYGRDISAYLEAPLAPGMAPLDNAPLDVRSNWRAPRYNGLRCKGVKHAILTDLYRAELISEPPPADWRDVPLETAQAGRMIRPLSEVAPIGS